mmetsp:Transcript_9518/g.29619  ORF Transcript_9518/g.29619 Transcript_9518/m.29619 type:complete len:303 (-) Transcript_9518:124-1032(-)
MESSAANMAAAPAPAPSKSSCANPTVLHRSKPHRPPATAAAVGSIFVAVPDASFFRRSTSASARLTDESAMFFACAMAASRRCSAAFWARSARFFSVSAAASKARFSSTAFLTSASRCSMSLAVRSNAAASLTLQAAICSSASASPSTFALSSSAAGGGPLKVEAASLAASVALMALSSRWTAAFSARSALLTAWAYCFCAFCASATAASTVAAIFRISSFRALAASEFTEAPPKKSNKDGLSATTSSATASSLTASAQAGFSACSRVRGRLRVRARPWAAAASVRVLRIMVCAAGLAGLLY